MAVFLSEGHVCGTFLACYADRRPLWAAVPHCLRTPAGAFNTPTKWRTLNATGLGVPSTSATSHPAKPLLAIDCPRGLYAEVAEFGVRIALLQAHGVEHFLKVSSCHPIMPAAAQLWLSHLN